MKNFIKGFVVLVFLFLCTNVFATNGDILVQDTSDPTTEISYQSHVSDIGWQDPVSNGVTSGTTGQAKHIEALRIETPGLNNLSDGSNIQYQAFCSDIGWQDPVGGGSQAGTTGENKSIEAVKICLTGPASNNYDVYYRVHSSNIGWLDWTSNDNIAGTTDLALPVEAIEITILPKGNPIGASTENPYYNRQILNDKVQLLSEVEVETLGWQPPVEDGNTVGTEGQRLGIEALKMNITNLGGDSQVNYNLMVENIGWQNNQVNGCVAGTENQNLQAEAVSINLSGTVANLFDVYYQAQCEDQGWLGWTSNGGAAGTTGGNKKLETIRVALVLKGDPAPTSELESYREIHQGITADQVPNFNLICAIVQHEGGDSYEGALAVMSCVMNRCDSGRWGGKDPVSVLTAPGQFSSYLGGYYKQFLDNPSPVVQQAVLDCLNGKRNHPYESFRAYPTAGSVNIGDNWYF